MRGQGYGWIEFVDGGGWEHGRKLYKKERKENYDELHKKTKREKQTY